jgi:hypothetical protein
MPHPITELALVAVETRPLQQEGSERSPGAGGPGWFDSSWELHRGLEVREGWSDDERVHGWIEDFLRSHRSGGRVAAPSPSTAGA